jgi:NAD+ kinase
MKIALHGRPVNDDAIPYIEELLTQLQQINAEIYIYSGFFASIQKKKISAGKVKIYETPADLKKTDFILSIGGDGTLLETVTFVGKKQIPILGINMGRLGFLAATPREEISRAITALSKEDFLVEERSLIKLISNEDIFEGINYGLNEFTILKRESSSMIVVHTYIDKEYLNSYWADGLIVSTPTGSTGYSLSCGGPLLLPNNKSFIIAPVSPHNLNVRPMVVPDSCEISFEVEARSKRIMVSLDSRSRSIPVNLELKVKKADFPVKLIALKSYNYLQTLRSKLNWGLDLRN